MIPMAPKPTLGVAVLLLAAVLVACGGETEADRILAAGSNKPLTAEDEIVERRLVTDDDVRKHPEGSAERAFLEYWNAVSYEDWASAVRFVDTGLRRALDTKNLVSAFAIEGQRNLPVRPLIRGAVRTRASVSIRYFVRTEQGKLRPTSSSWERRGEDWYLVYSATLDDSYASAVQQAKQTELDPLGATPDERAVRAGNEARRDSATTLEPPILRERPEPDEEPEATPTPTPEP